MTSTVPRSYAAVDLGAASGRVMVGEVGPDRLELRQVHRFRNEPVRLPDGLHWDVVALYREILAGLNRAGEVASAGVDSWGVDYGLIGADGALLGLPYHYRDGRTDRIAARDLYATTGIQHLAFNTVYQLLAEPVGRLAATQTMLLMPDLLGYWLTGAIGAERTNASTTALYDVRTRSWSDELCANLGIPAGILPPLRDPGEPIGSTRPHTGLHPAIPIVSVASHDTASAVLAVPASDPNFAYISTGTWSLVGIELDAPILSDASRDANFTNETGIDGTIRYLRNVMGLWLLQECQRAWNYADTGALVAEAAEAPAFAALVDPDDQSFAAPGDMPARIDAYCLRTGQRPPVDRAAYTRCILESLAIGHRAAVRDAVRLSGHTVDVVHLVGGGALNPLLCQLTADACELPVLAGPVEATALGNVLVQARRDGRPRDHAAMRELVAATQAVTRYEPRGARDAWGRAAASIGRSL
ncbi:MAG TPA: rhamnulokinase family protein [Micromonosporaceae bacterium]|jgi:rhamnulokinase